jgi:hypothetical protein
LIGEKFAKLEYLELGLKNLKAEDAIVELMKYLPGLRGLIKEVQKDGSENRVKKIVKF